MHLVQASSLRNTTNSVIALSLTRLPYRLISQSPELDISYAGTSPLKLNSHINSLLRLECSDSIFPIILPTSQRALPERSSVMSD